MTNPGDRAGSPGLSGQQWTAVVLAVVVGAVGVGLRSVNVWLGHAVIVLAIVGVVIALRLLRPRVTCVKVTAQLPAQSIADPRPFDDR